MFQRELNIYIYIYTYNVEKRKKNWTKNLDNSIILLPLSSLQSLLTGKIIEYSGESNFKIGKNSSQRWNEFKMKNGGK